MPKKSEKKRDKKTSQKRLKKRIMRGCSKTLRGGNFETPTFQVGISKFYPMNTMATDVQRNMTMDRGLVGGSRKRRYSRKYLDPLKKKYRGGALLGGAFGGLAPVEYKPTVIASNPAVQPISVKYSDSNPYLV